MPGASVIVVAGGSGSRLGGVKKALLRVDGQPVIERVIEAVRGLGTEIIVVDNDDSLAYLANVRIVRDRELQGGSLMALGSGLDAASSELCVALACDMPFVSGKLLHWMMSIADGYDAVVPEVDGRLDPLHAVYRRAPSLGALEALLVAGERRMTALVEHLRVQRISQFELEERDPGLRSLFNINSPADLDLARLMVRSASD